MPVSDLAGTAACSRERWQQASRVARTARRIGKTDHRRLALPPLPAAVFLQAEASLVARAGCAAGPQVERVL